MWLEYHIQFVYVHYYVPYFCVENKVILNPVTWNIFDVNLTEHSGLSTKEKSGGSVGIGGDDDGYDHDDHNTVMMAMMMVILVSVFVMVIV